MAKASLENDLKSYARGDREALSRKQSKSTEKKPAPSLEEFVAKLSPEAREKLYDVLVDYSFRDFRDEGEDEDEATEEDNE